MSENTTDVKGLGCITGILVVALFWLVGIATSLERINVTLKEIRDRMPVEKKED
jgi:hypothetical protein